MNKTMALIALGVLVSDLARAMPITEDPCTAKPAVVPGPKYSPVARKPSEILGWVTVRSGGPQRVDAPRCTDPVLNIPEPEVFALEIDVPFPELLLDEHPVLWTQPEFGRGWGDEYGGPRRHHDRRHRPPHHPVFNVPEPSPLWLMCAGLLVLLTRRRSVS